MSTIRVLAAVLIISAPLAAKSPWAGSLTLPPGATASIPITLGDWPTDEWAFEFWVTTGFDAAFSLEFGAGAVNCVGKDCTATMRTASTTHVHTFELYPTQAQHIRLELRATPTATSVSVLRSYAAVSTASLWGTRLPVTEIAISSTGIGAVKLLPVRAWRTVDEAGKPWTFRDPPAANPDLIGLWTTAPSGVMITDVTGRNDGFVTGGVESAAQCWFDTRPGMFVESFESGNWERWTPYGLP